MFTDIAAIVSEKSVHPENNRPYTTPIIQNAMKQIHYSVSLNKSAKKQALDVITRLKAIMPIARVHMLVSVIVPAARRFPSGCCLSLRMCISRN
jgi:ribosome maturation protein SDO1